LCSSFIHFRGVSKEIWRRNEEENLLAIFHAFFSSAQLQYNTREAILLLNHFARYNAFMYYYF
jgi:hypothetical protein